MVDEANCFIYQKSKNIPIKKSQEGCYYLKTLLEVISDLDSGNFTVIDIRAEDECIQTSSESIKIPFHKLKTEFNKLPKDKEYLLYCEKGIMSQLHAQYLRDENKSENVRVYRPIKN